MTDADLDAIAARAETGGWRLSAHAHDDVPALVDEVRRLRDENKRLRTKLEMRHELAEEAHADGMTDADNYCGAVTNLLAAMDPDTP